MTFGIGIIGCGSHAQHHAKNYSGYFVTLGSWDPNFEAMSHTPGIHFPTIEAFLLILGLML